MLLIFIFFFSNAERSLNTIVVHVMMSHVPRYFVVFGVLSTLQVLVLVST